MKKSLILLAALLLMNAFAWTARPSWADEPESPAPADSSKSTEAPKDGESGGKKKPSNILGGKFAGDPIFVRLQPIVLPILGDTGPEQLVTIQITVQVKDYDSASDMETNMPRVMDALIQALYGGLGSGSLRDGRLVDAAKIKAKALTALQGVQGMDSIKDVLIVNMSQRLL